VQIPSQPQTVTIEVKISNLFALKLMREIISPLNCLGASQCFGQHLSIHQLTEHYLVNGAFQRFMERNKELIDVTIRNQKFGSWGMGQ